MLGMANVNAVVDAFLHPEIPYFDAEHLVVGIINASVSGVLFFLVLLYVQHLSRVERDLRESEERFRAVFERGGDIALLLEPRAEGPVIVDVNEAACQVHGFSREELVGRSILSLNAELDEEHSKALVQRSLSGETIRFETVHRCKDGTTFPVEVLANAIQRADKPPIIVSLERDIRQRKELEAQLRQAQKMEAIGTLAEGIAHDFNNILTPVMAHADLALMQMNEHDPVREHVKELLTAAERAAELVRQILVISRKGIDGPPVPIPFGSLVNEVAILLRASLPTIDIRVEVDPACGPVMGDVSQLHQMILNLCTNAGYAMREKGGTLSLSLDRTGDEQDGQWVRLTVRDTGEGIPPKVIGRIFEPYFTTKPVGKGSGLGLAIVHGIVTRFGGRIRVESTPGEGTRFEVSLPVFSAQDASPRSSAPEIHPGVPP